MPVYPNRPLLAFVSEVANDQSHEAACGYQGFHPELASAYRVAYIRLTLITISLADAFLQSVRLFVHRAKCLAILGLARRGKPLPSKRLRMIGWNDRR